MALSRGHTINLNKMHVALKQQTSVHYNFVKIIPDLFYVSFLVVRTIPYITFLFPRQQIDHTLRPPCNSWLQRSGCLYQPNSCQHCNEPESRGQTFMHRVQNIVTGTSSCSGKDLQLPEKWLARTTRLFRNGMELKDWRRKGKQRKSNGEILAQTLPHQPTSPSVLAGPPALGSRFWWLKRF